MAWKKETITTESGNTVEAQAPEIISASRSTDIPAFYADWFFHRLKVGYSVWTNPFNNKPLYVSYQNTRFIVFWSKNPRPLLPHLDYLKERGIHCYVQYTLNDYDHDNLELNVPPLDVRIDTFKQLVDKLGVGGVVWRFDPLILTDTISRETLLGKIQTIGDQLRGYTEKMVFSFADITEYRKVKANLEKSGIHYHVWQPEEMLEFAEQLAQMNRERGWNYQLATCGEKVDLSPFGIEHNRCIDDRLMVRRAYSDPILMKVLSAEINVPSLFEDERPENAIELDNGHYAVIMKNNKDKGQRLACGCMISKDIGQYNTCIHDCEYCYANDNKQSAKQNYLRHRDNPLAETITGL